MSQEETKGKWKNILCKTATYGLSANKKYAMIYLLIEVSIHNPINNLKILFSNMTIGRHSQKN